MADVQLTCTVRMMHREKVSASEALCSLEGLTIGQEIEDVQR